MDSQSFPLQIPGFTDLAAKGAYSSSQVYTPADVQDIISYAGEVRTTCSTSRGLMRTQRNACSAGLM